MTKSLAWAAALAALLAGCGSDDEKPGLGAPSTFPVPGCERIDHHPCDIRASRCQERLMELAACLRGSEPLPVPPVTTMTEDEFAAYLNQGFAENPPPEPNHYEIALTLLGLAQRGALGQEARVASDVEFVWGLYRNSEKDIVIVDHGTPSNEPDPNSVLVHEFVHALQDADVDLGGFFSEHSTSYDSYLATASVSEGEARFHQSRFWASLLGLDPAAIDWTEHFQSVVEFAEDEVLAAPSPYVATYSYFPYEFGARFVHHAWVENGPEGVDLLFATPPTRSLAVMASVSGIASADWPASEFTTLGPPAEWVLSDETMLGAWGLFVFLSRLTDASIAREDALELRSDRLGVYVAAGSPDETAVVWQLEFSTASYAADFEIYARRAAGAVFRSDNRLAFARSTGTSPLDWALVP